MFFQSTRYEERKKSKIVLYFLLSVSIVIEKKAAKIRCSAYKVQIGKSEIWLLAPSFRNPHKRVSETILVGRLRFTYLKCKKWPAKDFNKFNNFHYLFLASYLIIKNCVGHLLVSNGYGCANFSQCIMNWNESLPTSMGQI